MNGAGMVIPFRRVRDELAIYHADTLTLDGQDNLGGTAPGACSGRNIEPTSGFCPLLSMPP
jgi:hypothetical protein